METGNDGGHIGPVCDECTQTGNDVISSRPTSALLVNIGDPDGLSISMSSDDDAVRTNDMQPEMEAHVTMGTMMSSKRPGSGSPVQWEEYVAARRW